MNQIAVIGKRFDIRLFMGRKYSTVKPLESYVDIPLDRVYENRNNGYKFIMTNDYSVARNGITDRNEFAFYYPDKFKFSLHKWYDQIKSSGIEFVTKFNIVKPGTQRFLDNINIRSDVMAGVTFITDTDNTDNIDYARCYHDFLEYLFVNDDFTLKLLPKQFAKLQEEFTEKIKTVQRAKLPKLLDETDSRFHEKQLVVEANNIILAYYDLCSRIKKHSNPTFFEFFCSCGDIYSDYSIRENNLKRKNKVISWNEFLEVIVHQTGFDGTLALIDQHQPYIPASDPWKNLGILYGRLSNDAMSYNKELHSSDSAIVNSVRILQNMYAGMSAEKAMVEIMRMQNKILNDLEEHVEYLWDEDKYRYIKYMTHLVGFTEAQLISGRMHLRRVSGTPPLYETFEHNGVTYG